jgi:hypothetical protein
MSWSQSIKGFYDVSSAFLHDLLELSARDVRINDAILYL